MQINVVHNEDAGAIAEKIMACNYEPEKNPNTHRKAMENRKNCTGYFFSQRWNEKYLNFQLHFNLPTYISHGEI